MSESLLSDRMVPFLQEGQLEANAAQQLAHYATEDEQDVAHVAQISEHLLSVPLVHYVERAETARIIADDGLHCAADLPKDTKVNTFALDRSIGLDAYTFSSMAASPTPEYGSVGVLLSPGQIINRSIVTDTDINHLTVEIGEGGRSFADLSLRSQQRIREEYFGSMVRGADWLRIASWKILRCLKEKGFDEPVQIDFDVALGEIKHLGSVPKEAIIGVVDGADTQHGADNIARYEDSIIKLGLLPSSMASVLHMYRPEYHAPVIDRMQAGRGVWRRVLGLA